MGAQDSALNVLVADDDDTMRDTAAFILGRQGHRVTTSTNGFDALTKLQQQRFDVALFDVRMPGMNGIDLLMETKRRWPAIAVIMMSVMADVTVAVETMRLGAYFYATKDFEWDSLAELVKGAARSVDYRSECERLKQENADLRSKLAGLTPPA